MDINDPQEDHDDESKERLEGCAKRANLVRWNVIFSLSLVSLTTTIFAPFIIIIILTLSMQEDISELTMKVIQSLD